MPEIPLLIFDIRGDYGYFRSPEGTRTPISFPFTRTSVLGLIAAILGIPRNQYWNNNHPLAKAKIAIELMNNIQHTSLTLNYAHTKNIVSLSKISPLITNYSPTSFRGFVTDVRLDLIKNVHYRIYFHTEDEGLYSQLKETLEKRTFVYPPYLGHAFLLAEIEYIGEAIGKQTNPIKDPIDIDSVIPLDAMNPDFLEYMEARITVIPMIPIRMIMDPSKNKIIQVINTNFVIGKADEKPWKTLLKESIPIIKLKINSEEKTIIFMPTGFSEDEAKEHQKQTTIAGLPHMKIKEEHDNDTNIAKSRQILFIYDARDSIPNGEREPGKTGQRVDPDTGQVLVSDVAIKRMIRDFINDTYDPEKHPDLHILLHNTLFDENFKIFDLKKKFLNDLGLTETELKKMKFKEIVTQMCKRFIDVRLFGTIAKGSKELFAATGPIQFTISKSLNIPNINEYTLTTCLASDKNKGTGSMGVYPLVDYAIIKTYALLKHSLAKKTLLQESDILVLYRALWNGLKYRITRTKIQQNPRLLIGTVLKDPYYQIQNLKDSIRLLNKNVKKPKDTILDLTEFIDIIKEQQKKIDTLEIMESHYITYHYNDNYYSSIKELLEKEKISINIKTLTL